MIAAPGFFVWNPARGRPQFQHATYDAAVAEAKRLAGECPGEEFFVLGAFERFKRPRPDADRERVALPIDLDDWIPF